MVGAYLGRGHRLDPAPAESGRHRVQQEQPTEECPSPTIQDFPELEKVRSGQYADTDATMYHVVNVARGEYPAEGEFPDLPPADTWRTTREDSLSGGPRHQRPTHETGQRREIEFKPKAPKTVLMA